MANLAKAYDPARRVTRRAPTLAPPPDGTARWLLSEVLLARHAPDGVERRTAEGTALRALIDYYRQSSPAAPAPDATPAPLTETERIALRALLCGGPGRITRPLPPGPGTIYQLAGQAPVITPQEDPPMKLTALIAAHSGAMTKGPNGERIYAFWTQGEDVIEINTTGLAADVLPTDDADGTPRRYTAADLQDRATALGFPDWEA